MNQSNATELDADTSITDLLDYLYASLVNSIVVIRIYQIGYPITFLLGFIGNTASLITFSRVTLRKVSTGCLFIVLAISDTLFLLMCVFDFLEFGLKISFYGHVQYDDLCRFRSFVMNVSQVLSSWILVTISFDRWIRTRFPYKSGSLCTPKKALLVVFVLLILDVGLNSHILTPMFGMDIPGFALLACGPNLFNASYFAFYFLDWYVVQIVVICLAPVILMVFFLIDIIINIRSRKRAVAHAVTGQHEGNISQHNKNLQTQMFVLMTTSIAIFLITTLPVAIYKIKSPRTGSLTVSYALGISNLWIGLGWFQSLNYALNFYSHCLTSTLFRKEFKLQMKYFCSDQRARADAMELTATANGNRTQAFQ